MDIDEDMLKKVIAEMIVADIMSTYPTDSAEKTSTPTEKMAWIEVYDHEVDKAYNLSKEIKEYD